MSAGSSVLFDAPGPRARAISRVGSIVGLVLIAAVLVWAVTILATPRQSGGITLPGMFDESRWDIFAEADVWLFIGQGVLNTLRAAAVAAVGALALGVVFSLLRSSEIAWVRKPVAWLLEFLRGMPVLLMMLFILLVGSTGQFTAVVVALILYNGTLIGEALRAGLAALPRGQREAALSVGMRPFQSKMLVEFPQAFRQMLPIIVAQLVVLLKDTSLGYIVGYNELIRTTMNNLSAYYGNRYLFSLFFVTLAIYLTINLSLSWFARWLARRGTPGTGRRRGTGGPMRPDDTADPVRAILLAEAAATARASEDQASQGTP
ncbi:amino acid ABC transporter permease [Brooklawnia cerclae]|uniref:Glutamate transport system permease protein n=1 Tax=Brooklawnia cerclae TaxID=349934 RepID=A0ABX0SAI5_9ACTN|nr:ABC transporter permease subunit [Brooklawnia cerclae]NIH55414.1 glutamate transport system permease protein [Brooklawnia cerclae]